MLQPRPLAIASLLLASVVTASPARAGWPAGGKSVALVGSASWACAHARMFETADGGFHILSGSKQSTYTSYSVARVDHDGDAPPGYPAFVGLGGATGGISTEMRGFAASDSGYFLYSSGHFLQNSSVTVVQMVHPDGLLLPNATGWVLKSGGNPSTSAIAPGAVGDAFVLTTSFSLKRILRSGIADPAWPAAGVTLPASSSSLNSALVPDGTGGVVWFSPYGSAFVPCALRVDSTGLRHANWPATGQLALSNDPLDGNYDVNYDLCFIRQPLVRSGPDHCIAAWSRFPGGQHPRNLKIQRFSLDGVVDPNWPAAGVTIAEPLADTAGATLMDDGAGGAFVFWYSNGLPVGTHVLASGQVSGSPATSLLPPGAAYQRPYNRQNTPDPSPIRYVMADRTPDGRVVFAGTTLPSRDCGRSECAGCCPT